MRLVHLTPEKYLARIRRTGISATSRHGWGCRGVYAMPILPSFVTSHQWLRELRRRGSGTMVAVDFVIDDTEAVLVGHFTAPHTTMPVAAAAALIRAAESPFGYEIVVPRRIAPAEIAKVRAVPQLVGWRVSPRAKGQQPCGCPVCATGGYGDAKIRRRYG